MLKRKKSKSAKFRFIIVETIGQVYSQRAKEPDGDPDRKIVANCMIAIDHMTLAVTSLGTCWVMLMKPDEVAHILRLPDDVFPVAIMPLGFAAEGPAARPLYPLEEIAFDGDLEHAWKTKERGQECRMKSLRGDSALPNATSA